MRILLIEDSTQLQLAITTGLEKSGHEVDVAGDGDAGLSRARNGHHDLIILDVMLPGQDGLSVLTTLRREGHPTSVLMLTARDTVDDRVGGLRAGADDYLVKPFAFDELLARVEALGRRPRETRAPRLEVADLVLHVDSEDVFLDTRRVDLTPREYTLLEYLARRQGETVSRADIEEQLYDDRQPSSNAVDRMICALRAKLSSSRAAPLIHTRRGQGYVLEEREQ
ncbi:MAG: response regulator transcription factor [Acidobacteriota bacterium]